MQAIKRLLRPRPAVEAGRRLFAAASAHARQPALYLGGGIPDTNEGRFEAYTLHVMLVLHRLKGEGPAAAEAAQALFDAYVRNLDDALREMGVGDLSVGKKMRKLGEAFYGRVKHYDEAFAALPDEAPLQAMIVRTVFAGSGQGDAAGLCAYALAAMRALKDQPLEAVLDARLDWPSYGERS
jgi:cytochrome b pre-mRNA-processing protein 3